LAFVGVSLKNNKEQQELVRLMNENNRPIIICTGNAGTGKTFAALIAALQMKQEKKYSTIVYGRNPMPIGEDMGFLPGGLDEKYGPYMGPLYDNLEAIASLSNENLNPK
jgi:PhoH-like ATPase